MNNRTKTVEVLTMRNLYKAAMVALMIAAGCSSPSADPAGATEPNEGLGEGPVTVADLEAMTMEPADLGPDW